MSDPYSDLQTVQCPSCGDTTMRADWKYGEHNGVREWTCSKCGAECEKRLSTTIKVKE